MMVGKGPWTGDDARHNRDCHQRWLPRRNRVTGEPGYLEAWYDQQCGGCRFWVPLIGEMGRDYGACTTPESEFDMRLRFEHDGCPAFTARDDDSWG